MECVVPLRLNSCLTVPIQSTRLLASLDWTCNGEMIPRQLLAGPSISDARQVLPSILVFVDGVGQESQDMALIALPLHALRV